MLKIIRHTHPDAKDPSVVVQRRKEGVRVMVFSMCLDGRLGGFIGAQSAATIDEAADMLCEKLVADAKKQAFAIENAIALPEQAE